jgi:hypothetical protein
MAEPQNGRQSRNYPNDQKMESSKVLARTEALLPNRATPLSLPANTERRHQP